MGIPIPLPGSIGRTYAGEIAEASSLARRNETEVEIQQRAVRLELTKAFAVFGSRRSQVDLYDAAQIASTERSLRDIAAELGAGRLPVRDALLTQQSLVDYLLGSIEAKRQLCIASVELARLAGGTK